MHKIAIIIVCAALGVGLISASIADSHSTPTKAELTVERETLSGEFLADWRKAAEEYGNGNYGTACRLIVDTSPKLTRLAEINIDRDLDEAEMWKAYAALRQQFCS